MIILRGIGKFLRFFLFVTPLVPLSLVGLWIIEQVGTRGFVGIIVGLGVLALLVLMWIKAWRWQLRRIQADRVARRIEKLYRIFDIEVAVRANSQGHGRYNVEIFTPPGYSDNDIINKFPELSAYLRAVSVTPVPDDDPHDGHVAAFIAKDDVLKSVEEPDDLPTYNDIKCPLNVGMTIYGTPLELLLWQEHFLIGGMSGRGKSVLANRIIESLQQLRQDGQIEVWGVDPHRTEFADKDFDRLAKSTDRASDVFTELLDEGDRRLQIMEERGWKKWDPAEGPAIVLLVDELAAIFDTGDKNNDSERKRNLTRIYAELRKAGITAIGMTQTPSAQLLGTLRNNAGVRVAFGCATDDQLGQILGTHWTQGAEGVSAREIPPPTERRETRGMCFVVGGNYDRPTLARVYAPQETN